MAKKLTARVHLYREDGSYVVYAPGDSVPAADAKLITNPKAWGEDEPAKTEKSDK